MFLKRGSIVLTGFYLVKVFFRSRMISVAK